MEDGLYKETLHRLIEKYKSAIEQCLDVIGKSIDDSLADDKLHNVLKAKRLAGEDVKFYAKEIQSIEDELTGNTTEEIDSRSVRKKYTKK